MVSALAFRMQHVCLGFQQVAVSNGISNGAQIPRWYPSEEPRYPMVSHAKTTSTQWCLHQIPSGGAPLVQPQSLQDCHGEAAGKLEVKIDRRCLFAFDVINGMFVASPQQAGIKCPWCNKNQEQWDLEQNIWKRSRNVGTENQGFVTIEQSELRQIPRLTCETV